MKKYLSIAAAAMLIASCSGDAEVEKTQDRQAPLPIQLGTSMQVTTRSNDQGLQATELASGQTAGVYVYYTEAKAKGSGVTYGYQNLEYSASGTAGDLDLAAGATTPYYPENKSQAVDIYVYSPRVASLTGELDTQTSVPFETKGDQTADTDYLASDFVWGVKTGVTTSSSAVEVPLNHKLSKININIAAGTGFSLASLEGAEITLDGVDLNGTLDLTTGKALTSGSTTDTLTFTSGTSTQGTFASSSTTSCYTASAVIIPQTVTGTLTVKLAAASGGSTGSTYTYSLSGADFTGAGKVYTYDIFVNAGGLSLTTTITDWDSTGITPVTGSAT